MQRKEQEQTREEQKQTRQHMDRLLDIVRDMSVALACMEKRLIEATRDIIAGQSSTKTSNASRSGIV